MRPARNVAAVTFACCRTAYVYIRYPRYRISTGSTTIACTVFHILFGLSNVSFTYNNNTEALLCVYVLLIPLHMPSKKRLLMTSWACCWRKKHTHTQQKRKKLAVVGQNKYLSLNKSFVYVAFGVCARSFSLLFTSEQRWWNLNGPFKYKRNKKASFVRGAGLMCVTDQCWCTFFLSCCPTLTRRPFRSSFDA